MSWADVEKRVTERKRAAMAKRAKFNARMPFSRTTVLHRPGETEGYIYRGKLYKPDDNGCIRCLGPAPVPLLQRLRRAA